MGVIMTKKPEVPTSRQESVAVAFENAAICALTIAAQIRDPKNAGIIPESCRSAGADLGDLTDGEASVSFVVVAVAATVDDAQK